MDNYQSVSNINRLFGVFREFFFCSSLNFLIEKSKMTWFTTTCSNRIWLSSDARCETIFFPLKTWLRVIAMRFLRNESIFFLCIFFIFSKKRLSPINKWQSENGSNGFLFNMWMVCCTKVIACSWQWPKRKKIKFKKKYTRIENNSRHQGKYVCTEKER